MAERLPPRPPKPGWGNLSKNLALWVLVGLLALALFQFMSSQKSPALEFTFTEFGQQLDASNVASVEIYAGKYVEGEFKSPVLKDGRSVKAFKVNLPIANSADILKRMEAAHVAIDAK